VYCPRWKFQQADVGNFTKNESGTEGPGLAMFFIMIIINSIMASNEGIMTPYVYCPTFAKSANRKLNEKSVHTRIKIH